MNKLKEAVKDFLQLLETTEISDSGHEFYPTHISTVRVLHQMKIREVLKTFKEETEE